MVLFTSFDNVLALEPDLWYAAHSAQQPFASVPQKSQEWLEGRRERVTGSIVSKLIFPWGRVRHRFPESRADFSEAVLNQQDEIFAEWHNGGRQFSPRTQERIDFGVENEDRAVGELLNYRADCGDEVKWLCVPGLLLDPHQQEFGASIDGLMNDSIIEAKCSMWRPYNGYRDYHYDQMQWNMGVVRNVLDSDRFDICWFVGFSRESTRIQPVAFNDDYCRDMRASVRCVLERYVREWCPANNVVIPPHLESYMDD